MIYSSTRNCALAFPIKESRLFYLVYVMIELEELLVERDLFSGKVNLKTVPRP
jgi:hypothetical protein